MRRGSALIVCLMLMSLLYVAPVFADRTTEDLQSRIIERFDSPDGSGDAGKYEFQQNNRWIVRGSKFITKGFPKFEWVKTFPSALYAKVPEGADYRSFGIQAAFDRQGYNFLELVPVADKNADNGDPIPKGIPIPGRIKNLDMWVWGSNYRYYVDVHFRDFQGVIHVLRMGYVNYKGWRNLRVEIPNGIPQDVAYLPSRQGLELAKIVLWTEPDEKVAGFYVYFDNIKIMTDMFETPFDGSGLGDAETIKKLWSSTGAGK